MNTPLFRKLNLEAYKPGRSFLNKKKSIIKLSANESALGMSKNANKAILKSKNNISKYPDGKFKELTSTISKKYNCKQNQIICGSGSDEIIQMLCQLFLNKGDEKREESLRQRERPPKRGRIDVRYDVTKDPLKPLPYMTSPIKGISTYDIRYPYSTPMNQLLDQKGAGYTLFEKLSFCLILNL